MAPNGKLRIQTKVCCCTSHKCNSFLFRNAQGQEQPGVQLSLGAFKQHAADDHAIVRASTILEARSRSEPPESDTESETPEESGSLHTSQQDQNDAFEPSQSQHEPNSRTETYDCSSFFSHPYFNSHPVVLYSSLFAALSNLLNHSSVGISSYILKSHIDLVKITLSHGVLQQPPCQISHPEKLAVQTMPSDVRTVISSLKIDPRLKIYVCCRQCFAIYESKEAPDLCTHSYIHLRDNKVIKKTPGRLDDLANCDQPLFKSDGSTPIRQYATQDIFHWLARLFSRPNIEDALDLSAARSRKLYDPHHLEDIQDSRIWKEFKSPNGDQFTAQSGNIVFGMFTDGINPHGNRTAGKHVSVTFIILVCLSLPIEIRRKPENVFLAGIAPGPREPSLEMVNWVLQPIVDQLSSLWKDGMSLSQTYRKPSGRRIFAALLPFFADLPAVRRTLGFASFAATRMCSYCLLEKKNINNTDSTSWPKRTLEQHRISAAKYDDTKIHTERQKLLRQWGTRYSALLKLEYWNIIDYHVVDSMHNLLLGLLNWHCRKFWNMSEKSESESVPPSNMPHLNTDPSDATFNPYAIDVERDDVSFVSASDDGWQGEWTSSSETVILDGTVLSAINKFLPRIHIPTWIKRAIPALGKASFGRLKADEWRNLFVVQLTLVLPALWNGADPEKRSLLHNFAHLVSVVNIALARSTSSSRISAYRHHIKSYIESCLKIRPDVSLAPNHHMALHLADCLERFGPTRAWWSFPMERLMADILKSPDNNQSSQMEITFMKKFCQIGNIRALLDMPGFPASFQSYLLHLKALYDVIPFQAETVSELPGEFLDSQAFDLLITKLNKKKSHLGARWVSSTEYHQKDRNQRLNYSPVSSKVKFLTNHRVADAIYSARNGNENNSIVTLKPGLGTAYGQLESIFQHSRHEPTGDTQTDVFCLIKPLMPIPPGHANPYKQLSSNYDVYVSLCVSSTDETLILLHEREIKCHSAWIKYNPGELSSDIQFETIALVSLDRS